MGQAYDKYMQIYMLKTFEELALPTHYHMHSYITNISPTIIIKIAIINQQSLLSVSLLIALHIRDPSYI